MTKTAASLEASSERLTLKYARVQKLSMQYKVAITEAHLISRVSEQKFAQLQATLVHATMEEMFRQGLTTSHIPLSDVTM